MKKLLLLSTLILVSVPAFAAQYSVKVSPSYAVTRSMRHADNQILQAFLAGTSIASGRILVPNSIRTLNPALSYLDPYIVSINGKNYILIKDNKDNKWNVENILGHDDSKDNLFASLKNLETDGDASKITVDELKKANIRFALLNSDGTVALNDRNLDYDLNNVLYIDMKNLRTALGNKNQDGTFGYFYVIVKHGNQKRAVTGRVTFEEKNELNKYLQ